MKVYSFIEREELIHEFAEEMASLQKKADIYYYINEDKEMSDFVLNYATEVKFLAAKLGIYEEMYQEAYKIYDFRDSDRTSFKSISEIIDN